MSIFICCKLIPLSIHLLTPLKMKAPFFQKQPLTIILILVTMITLLSACNNSGSYSGYRLIEKKFVKEVNAECYLLEHIKSGARVLKIAADDPNKTFSIALKTIPESDAGTPHILEHSVLNGSKNFPVKSPFDVLSKGSLNTFLNAMTSSDWTIYPVASMNNKDYFNLMHVYCDAVFNPLIYSDPRILMQEGWHYELTGEDAPLEYKGVVYNEMKGAFSSPTREMWYRIQKNLFPDNQYRYSSGGYPSAIPTLTYEDFLAFHGKYYHPSNSYIFLYGDADLKEELAFLDREYLSNYDKPESLIDIQKNPPFDAIKEIVAYFPVLEGAPVDEQTFLAMNWVVGEGSDQAAVMALNVLADVLVNQESAPVRKALQEAGIGKDVYAVSDNMLQNVFSIVVQNADPGDKDKFREVIMNTLQKVYSEKIDRKTLEGSLNRMEFRLREGDDAQKGISYNLRALTGWLFTNDPFPSLEYEPQLTTIKTSLESNYLEDIIKRDLLENHHGVLLTLEPKPGLDREIAKKTEDGLAEQKRNFTSAEIDSLISSTRELIANQKKEDSPEALATIPLLKLSDISPAAQWYEPVVSQVDGIEHLFYKEFTNDIVYMNFWFDLRVLPQELIPYAAVVTELLGKMDAGGYDFEEIDKSLNINTGGFNASLNVFVPGYNDDNLLPKLGIQMKTTAEKLDTSIALLSAILCETNVAGKDRLLELLKRLQSQVESHVTRNGFNVGVTRLESYLSQQGMFSELTRGAQYYWFVTDLVGQFEKNPENIIANLKKVQALVFTRGNLMAGTTCSEDDYKLYAVAVKPLLASLPDVPSAVSGWTLGPVPLNEGLLTTSKVQFVLEGNNFRKLGLAWDGKWNVLNQIMSTDWLQKQVRVIGGAYGGFSSINKKGFFYFASYRDPNLKETLDNFAGTVNYLSAFNADSVEMTRYIIGTIANLDFPLTPSERGNLAFRWYMEKTSREEVQADRDAVLTTTAADIRNMSDVVAKILEPQVYCVYGNEDILKTNKDLFKDLVVLQK